MKHRGAHVIKKQVENRLMRTNEAKFFYYQRKWNGVLLSTQREGLNVFFQKIMV